MKYLRKLEEKFGENTIVQLIVGLGFIVYFALKWTWDLVSDQWN